MKRFISAALVLLTLAVAVFFFLKMRRFLPERPRGAELAPAETIFFAQFPNLRQSAARIPQTDLYQIWSEPDVQAFLEKPRRKVPWMRAWSERLVEIARVAPGEFFVAITSVAGPQPKFAGGFSFAGSQQNAETLAAHLREQLLPTSQIVSSFRENWHFFASDAGLLEEMLARFDGKPGAVLVADPVFQQAIAPLEVGQDLVIYGKPNALSGQFDLLTGLGGSTKSNGPESLAMATKIEGGKLRDTIFLQGSAPIRVGAFSRQTLSLASPQTLLYYVTDSASLQPEAENGMLKGLLPSVARMEKALAEKGLTWSDLSIAVGPEAGVMCEWPEDAALPTVLLASEIREPDKARTFVEVLTNPPASESAWKVEDHDGISVLSAPPQMLSFVRPAVALTDRFALLGLSPETVTGALSRTKPPTTSLEQSPAFQDVIRFVPEQAAAFAYLDFKPFFERVYRMARPFITLSVAFSVEAGAQIDAGKLPPVESIAKHLSATVLTQSRVEGGTMIQSIGSLTIPELLIGAGAGAAASGLPDLSGVIPGGGKIPSPSKPAPPRPNPAPVPTVPEKTVP